jgi:hypothetical protein
VADLAAAAAFFRLLGLKLEGIEGLVRRHVRRQLFGNVEEYLHATAAGDKQPRNDAHSKTTKTRQQQDAKAKSLCRLKQGILDKFGYTSSTFILVFALVSRNEAPMAVAYPLASAVGT